MPCDFRLEVFITVCRTGSFTRAADSLGISQPAVSQNISGLEKDLGVRLFTRSRGEVTLTSDGNLFRNYAERILYWYDSARSAFRGGKSSPVQIEVHSTSDLSSAVVPGLFSVLRHSFPDLVFVSRTFVPGSRPADTETENAVYLYSSVGIMPQYETPLSSGDVLIGTCSPVVAVSPLSRYLRDAASSGYGYARDTGPKLAVLSAGADGPLQGIAYGPGSRSSGRPLEEVLAASGLYGRIVFVSDSAEAVKQLAKSDPDAAAVLPSYCVQDELSDGRLAQLPSFQLPDIRYSVRVSMSESLRSLAVSEDILRIIREILSPDPLLHREQSSAG